MQSENSVQAYPSDMDFSTYQEPSSLQSYYQQAHFAHFYANYSAASSSASLPYSPSTSPPPSEQVPTVAR